MVGYGNFDTKKATASIGGPISDNLKFIVSGSFRDTDGPFTNITTGEKVQRYRSGLGRARLLWEPTDRSEEHTSELQSLMRISYAVFCLKKKKKKVINITYNDRC